MCISPSNSLVLKIKFVSSALSPLLKVMVREFFFGKESRLVKCTKYFQNIWRQSSLSTVQVGPYLILLLLKENAIVHHPNIIFNHQNSRFWGFWQPFNNKKSFICLNNINYLCFKLFFYSCLYNLEIDTKTFNLHV